MALGSNNMLPNTFINKKRVYVLNLTLWSTQGFRWDGQAKYSKLLAKEMTQDTLYVSLKLSRSQSVKAHLNQLLM